MTVAAGTGPSLKSAAWQALGTVLDPELDQPITELNFVAALDVGEGADIHLDLRLPTYFCAPNFAYLMVSDADEVLRALPGVGRVRVRLVDHFAAEEINAGVAAGTGFGSAFPGMACDELAELRRTFLRKAHSAYQEQLANEFLRAGRTLEELVSARLREAPEGWVLARLHRRREALGLPAGPEAPLLVDDGGRPLDAEELPVRLRFARTTRVSIEGNAGWCRGLLTTRYGPSRPADANDIAD